MAYAFELVDIGKLKVFSDLAEAGSFSKAASINGITQSAVSQQIRALETRYGVCLIERGRRSFALTEAGQVFLKASREILGIYTQLGERIAGLSDEVAGELRIASIYSIGLHELPGPLKRFRERYPEVAVQVDYRHPAQVYELVEAGEVELGLVAYPAKHPGLQVEVFAEDELVLICHPKHEFAGLERVNLGRLRGERFIAFEPDLPTRKVIDRHLREHGVETVHTMEFDNLETVKRAVEIESGVSIVPANTVKQEVEQGVLARVFLEGPKLSRPLGVLTKRNRAQSAGGREFLALLRGLPGD